VNVRAGPLGRSIATYHCPPVDFLRSSVATSSTFASMSTLSAPAGG
jgi:hypothetical protein